jgi:hypothetical protein
VHAACHHIAEDTSTLRENVLYLCVANLTYLGCGHSAALQDMARAVADLMAASPQRAAALVFMPNTPQKGMASSHSEEFVRAARRQTMEKFEDTMWKLDSRECTFHFDEDQMYSPSRPLSHSMLFLMSDGADKTDAYWRKSPVWNRKCIPGHMSVLQRADFINPMDKTEGQTTIKKSLSESAELRQHVTGVAFYQQVPQTQCKCVLSKHPCTVPDLCDTASTYTIVRF